ncbi:hypothetical protein ENTCAN_08599 [Enterobacter cancerogenus ATCC 35316]|nr:hypothetical protein ENTCAN_08599 [Enterobacter cancerogenus ATCC 35316]
MMELYKYKFSRGLILPLQILIFLLRSKVLVQENYHQCHEMPDRQILWAFTTCTITVGNG